MISQRFKILMVTLITGVLVIAYQAAEFFNGWGFDPISFVIADGIIAMEGNGPSGESASCLRVARLRWCLATSGGVYGVLTKLLSSKSGIA